MREGRLPGRRLHHGLCLPLRPGKVPAGTVAQVPLLSGVGRRGGQPLGPAAPAGVDGFFGPQLCKGGVVEGGALPLAVRPVRSPHAVALIPVQTQPPQVLHDVAGPGLPGTVRVQILHPQNHLSPHRPGIQPGYVEGKQISQVHPPAGAGGKPSLFRHMLHAPLLVLSIPLSVPRSAVFARPCFCFSLRPTDRFLPTYVSLPPW